MFKVLLVDDEDIEREAMAAIIPWEEVDMELVDMAWNGIEGLEKIEAHVPDIVITDIKMPVMDGIELIRRAQKLYPHMAFVVLSGYGEYEYTSRAMELGIRHYILKPCDEEKIVEVLSNVKDELRASKEKERSEKELQNSFQRMLPHLKEQILYELLTRKELSLADQALLNEFTKSQEDNFILLSVRSPIEFDQLDRFALMNIVTELVGEKQIYASAALRREIIYLIPARLAAEIPKVMKKAHEAYFMYKKVRLRSAVSGSGTIEESYLLYCQIEELFYFGGPEANREVLSRDMYHDGAGTVALLIDYEGIRNAGSYGDLIFEVYASCAKMEREGMPFNRMQEIYGFAMKILFGVEAEALTAYDSVWGLLEAVVDCCAEQLNLSVPDTKDGERLRNVLYTIYKNIKNPDLSLQYLASDVLFMNEDYFGRFFSKYLHEKYS